MKNQVRKVALLFFKYPEGKDKLLLRIYDHNYAQFREQFPDIEFVHCGSEKEYLEKGSDCDVLLTVGNNEAFDLDFIAENSPKVKWICSMFAGAEGLFASKIKDMKDVIFTCTKGVHGQTMTDHAIAFVYACLRSLPFYIRNQIAGFWRKPLIEELSEAEGKVIGIVGLGTIGSMMAEKFKALGFKVIGYKRVPAEFPCIDELYTGNDLTKLLEQSDFVILILPLTPHTKGFFGEDKLKSMKNSAVLINMGRGQLVKTDDLVYALQNHQIAGACLDVTDPEPLPEDSPLWSMTNVIISPHCSPNSPQLSDRVMAQFCKNLRNYIDGVPMFNIVTNENDY